MRHPETPAPYPCKTCRSRDLCAAEPALYRSCAPFRRWFSGRWQAIRARLGAEKGGCP